jgi:hypothetical protein
VIEIGPNNILWAGMSEAFAAAVLGLVKEGLIHYAPTTFFVYMIDGGGLTRPGAKGPSSEEQTLSGGSSEA